MGIVLEEVQKEEENLQDCVGKTHCTIERWGELKKESIHTSDSMGKQNFGDRSYFSHSVSQCKLKVGSKNSEMTEVFVGQKYPFGQSKKAHFSASSSAELALESGSHK